MYKRYKKIKNANKCLGVLFNKLRKEKLYGKIVYLAF